ncbi:DDHD domain protein [Cordyceps militaris CM01]|uniref:DDHD domain protein n=1 Tax=Cordyceps militaris (strain CM01) TaxID=983644 RepID=G3JPU1_CORMM|nr:DDHD domain protein [Cordyceps militaris CM01]EGX89192.1 DDHD domain protein [Cordyceps militaris CM01]
MVFAEHTFDAKCRQTPVILPERDGGMPPVKAQFFYSSSIPIDDPLSASSHTATTDTRKNKELLRPFGRGDNNALETAWLSLSTAEDRSRHTALRSGKPKNGSIVEQGADWREKLVTRAAQNHGNTHAGSPVDQDILARKGLQDEVCCSELLQQIKRQLQNTTCSLARAIDPTLSPEAIAKDVAALVLRRQLGQEGEGGSQASPVWEESHKKYPGVVSTGSHSQPSTPKQIRAGGLNSAGHNQNTPLSWVGVETNVRLRSDSQLSDRSIRTNEMLKNSAPRDGITGKPFARVDDLRPGPDHVDIPNAHSAPPPSDAQSWKMQPQTPRDKQTEIRESLRDPGHQPTDQLDTEPKIAQVTVGISRLHSVDLPALQMKPIYWSPVNDIAVSRRDTMLPVSTAVANQLEAGYQELKPWTGTWIEELECALEVGAAGEEKVSHPLWPKHHQSLNGAMPNDSRPTISSDLFCAARCFRGDAAANGSIQSAHTEKQPPNRPFASYQVIYKDRKSAFLLKPSLAPSSYHGRRPLAKILRGLTVGLPVVRGFDRRSWNKQNSPKKAATAAEEAPSADTQEERIPNECPACTAEKDRGQITDLVLVAHGIGQKIAERVESYHFTHAINTFRRAVNIELRNPAIKNVLRADQNGFMILPLNWRVGLSFGSDSEVQKGAKDLAGAFDLKDIEPSTIPAVRSMISDVMFDIPFYMSHHKSKMIMALVREANRVYRLWCRNNPGFSDKGRVHLIAHSLGSVMAVDILSRQPTCVSRVNLVKPMIPDDQHFEFNTTNLFLAGSPAGFFLLLEKGALTPRRSRRKPGVNDGDVVAKNVAGEAGTFGCLAVDNVYNILAKEDPIAYLLTGAVDPSYASSLKVAYVPSVAPSLMSTVRDAIRQVIPGLTPEPDPLAVEPERPTTARMPSQLELEIHNFTREEIAEKKAYLLNDNGQIDWFLRSSGGPLEIQYLNMLSAHTSYWTNQDFIRMVCLEIGRKPGRSHTFPAMRAVKNVKRDVKT